MTMLHFLYSKEEDVDYLAAAGNDRQAKMNCTSFLMYTLQYNACYYYTYVSCAQKMHDVNKKHAFTSALLHIPVPVRKR